MTQPRPEGFLAGVRDYRDGKTNVRSESAAPPASSDIAAVDVATTATISLSGLQTIDGVSLSAGDKVLVKNQSPVSANGLYTVTSTAWPKAGQPKVVHVVKGTQNGRLCFYLTATNTYSANRGVFK